MTVEEEKSLNYWIMIVALTPTLNLTLRNKMKVLFNRLKTSHFSYD